MSAQMRHMVIAAGGTGGHLFPAQALAEEMLRRGWRVTLSTDPRGARYSGNFPQAVAQAVMQSGSFARGGISAKLTVPWHIFKGCMSALRLMRAERTAVVIGFGGYPALPAMLAAWLTRRPRLIHEQNAILGRVNQIFARHVAVVACGTWPTALPKGAAAQFTGNPARDDLLAQAGAPYQPPMAEGPLHLLAMGGSQGAHILTMRVVEALAFLPREMRARLRLTLQARAEDHEMVASQLGTLGIAAEVAPFFADIAQHLAKAQLVISRSGASSVSDIALIGRPSLLIPLKAALRGEQKANAEMLEAIGAAQIILEDDLTAQDLAVKIEELFTNPTMAGQMAAQALSAAKPDAVRDLADLVERVAGQANKGRDGQ